MAERVSKIPLYREADYFMYIPLEGQSFRFRMYYNEKVGWWMFDLKHSNGEPVLLGIQMTPNHPVALNNVIEDITGFFWLTPKGEYKNYTALNPLKLDKYFELYYYWDDGVEEGE